MQNPKTIDLHVHSCFSDGSDTPEKLVHLALEAGLSAFALTDHDTTDGIGPAMEAAEGTSLTVVPGIEFSTCWEHKDIHILGYLMDYQASGFQQRLLGFLNARDARNEKMCHRIREYTGFPIELARLQERWPDTVITRAHMATWLLEQGFVKSRKEAFDRYLGDHAACFVPKMQISSSEAVCLILQYGGVPVLAHPLLYALSKDRLERLILELRKAGLLGIEALYSKNKGNDEAFVRSLAARHGLIVTGGSDYHGTNKPDIQLGTGIRQNLSIPCYLLTELQAAKEAVNSSQES